MKYYFFKNVIQDKILSVYGKSYNNITITINTGEKLYISFQANVLMGSAASEISFYVYIDNMCNSDSYTLFQRAYSVGVSERHTMILQYVNSTLNPGTHVITIKGTSIDIGPNCEVCENSNLFAQTFI